MSKNAFWQPWLSTDTTFCRALVSSGYLSEEQMLRAADRYHLGRSRDGGVIFWQIDSRGTTRDGKIMYYRDDCHRDKSRSPSWCSARMKAYYGYDGDLPVDRCLFGLHLLEEGGKRLLCVRHFSFHFPLSTFHKERSDSRGGEDRRDHVGSLSPVCLDGGGRTGHAERRQAAAAQ